MTLDKAGPDALITQVIEGIENIKGENIKLLDLRALDNRPCDYFIVCNGNSNTQVTAIVNSIQKNVRSTLHEKPFHTEGTENAEWVLIDYVNVVVHVFQQKIREHFNIEGLWGDAKMTEIPSNY